MRRSALLLVAVLVAGITSAVTVVASAPAQAASTGGGTFVPVKQARIVDTRSGVGVPKAALKAGKSLIPTVQGGKSPIPASDGVLAVTGTLTVVSPTSGGGLTMRPVAESTAGKPATTNLQFRKGQAVSNSSITRVDKGKILITDTQADGSVQVIFDVTGYYRSDPAPLDAAGTFHALSNPARVMDSRTGWNTKRAKLTGGHTLVGSPGGHGGIPASGTDALVVTITSVGPTAAGSLTAFEPGTSRPTAATSYFGAGKGGSSFAIVPVSRYSQLDIYSATKGSVGSVDIVVDAVGYFSVGAPQAEGAYQPLVPKRVGLGTLRARQTLTHSLDGIPGLPRETGGALLATLTVVSPSRGGGITAYSSSDGRPGTTSIQYAAGEERLNQVLLPVETGRALKFYNASSGKVTVYLDVHGYIAPNKISPPDVSPARYLDDLTGAASSDETAMQAHGDQDGAEGTFVLLDVGAQTISPPLTSHHRGVAIALSQSNLHLTYGQLVDYLEVYLDAFAAKAGANTGVKVAVGTNNDGAWDPKGANYYTAASRGADWAAGVIQPLRSWAAAKHPHVDVVAADDIEAAFASTEAQAQQWENAYFARDKSIRLVYNGDANSCPATFGTVGARCAFGWTQSQYYSLAHRSDGRTFVLPQIFFPAEAVKWTNIDATGAAGSRGELNFLGSLTEYARDTNTLTADGGWSALKRGLSTLSTDPTLDRSVDLKSSPAPPALVDRRARGIWPQ